MTSGKTITLTRWTFVGKVMSLIFNILSRLVIAFLPRSKCLLISWLQSPSTVMLRALLLVKYAKESIIYMRNLKQTHKNVTLALIKTDSRMVVARRWAIGEMEKH